MTYALIHDPDQDVYALIDPDYGRALGPVLSGPDAPALLEAFLGALGVDPATIPPWILESRFQEFLAAINAAPPAEGVEAAPAGAAGDAVVPTQEPASPASSSTESSSSPPSSTPASSTTEPAATEGSSDTSGTTSAATTAPQASPAGDPIAGEVEGAGGEEPVEEPAGAAEPVKPTVPEGKVTCPQCEGWGTIARDGAVVPCPLCEGAGAVDQPVADAYAREQAAG